MLKSFYRIGRWAQCRFSAAVYHQPPALPIIQVGLTRTQFDDYGSQFTSIKQDRQDDGVRVGRSIFSIVKSPGAFTIINQILCILCIDVKDKMGTPEASRRIHFPDSARSRGLAPITAVGAIAARAMMPAAL